MVNPKKKSTSRAGSTRTSIPSSQKKLPLLLRKSNRMQTQHQKLKEARQKSVRKLKT